MTGEASHLNRSRKRVWEPPVNSSEGKMLLAEGGANANLGGGSAQSKAKGQPRG